RTSTYLSTLSLRDALPISLFAVMTPLGTLISHSVAMASEMNCYMNAIVIGIFLHISTTILFESSEDHKLHLSELLVIILGVNVRSEEHTSELQPRENLVCR